MDLQVFEKTLDERLKEFDYQGAGELCDTLVSWLYQEADITDYPFRAGEHILQRLRNKRLFELMLRVGDALMQTGRSTHKVKRLYAQALIDRGVMTAAILVLDNLVSETQQATPAATMEVMEAKGLLGRAYKQIYINAHNAGKETNEVAERYLQKAILSYLEVYTADPQKYLWHGINVVALVNRAAREGVSLEGNPNPQAIASHILHVVNELYDNERASKFDFATAAEACLALNDTEQALRWLREYTNSHYVDAFEIGSTLRQFTEVWQLEEDTMNGKLLLPFLQAALLHREGGQVTVGVQEMRGLKKEEAATSAAYEKVFGHDSFETYKWYMQGASRCLAVARIGRDSSRGIGTGFLVKGKDLYAGMEDELVLLTNSHVLSDAPSVSGALRPDEANIIFEALNPAEEFEVGQVLWSSPPSELDAIVIRFAHEDLERLRLLTEKVEPYPIARRLPVVDDTTRVYIIGYPAGGTLCLSLQDNLLLDHQEPLLHYRTPTVGGSSGSPVFNRQWQLIGIHHLGSHGLPRLNGKGGIYEANEGIWIQAVIKKLAADLA